MDESNSSNRRGRSTTRSAPSRRRRRRGLGAEIARSAQQIYKEGLGEAMRAAALLVVSRKLDEIRSLLVAGGVGSLTAAVNGAPTVVAVSPTAAPVPPKNPCVQCGRPGVYRSKPNQFNKTGSWFCRIHIVLGTGGDLEDQMDRSLQPTMVPSPPQVSPQASPPGASTLAEAMMGAQVVVEEN